MKKQLLYTSVIFVFLISGMISCSKDNDTHSDDTENTTDDDTVETEVSEISVITQTEEPTLDYGRVYPSFNKEQKEFYVANLGNVSLSVSSIDLPNGYSLSEPFTSFTLAPSESRTFYLEFYPEQEGEFNGTVRIHSNASAGTASFKVTGTGSTTTFDYDGNEYPIVRIGNQLWSMSNFRGVTYSDGTPISYASYNDQNLDITFGKLYPRDAIFYWSSSQDKPVTKKLMEDFIVPTNTDWNVLLNYLGGTTVAGGKLKQSGTDLWEAPNTGATNSSGFTALPAGSYHGGTIYNMGTAAKFWSYKFLDPHVYDFAYSCILVSGSQEALFQFDHNSSYYSVRLMKRKIE